MRDKPYTSRLQKGGALLDDMRLLVRHWDDEDRDPQRRRIIDDNLLGKKTKARSTDVYRRSFSQRFLKGDPPSAWKIVRTLENREVPIEILRPVYYWITARSDPVVYDFVLEEILTRSKRLDLSVRVDETVLWIKKKLSERDQSWADTVILRVARGLLAALWDFGILEGASKKRSRQSICLWNRLHIWLLLSISILLQTGRFLCHSRKPVGVLDYSWAEAAV